MSPRLLRLLPWLIGCLLAAPLGIGLLQDGVYVGNGTDLYSYQVPLHAMVGAALRAGHWPAWNPYALAGVPAHAGMQLGLTYPPDLATSLIFGVKASEWLLWLHLVWLAAGTWFLARVHTGRQPIETWRDLAPAGVAAAIVVGSGPTWGHVFAGHVSLIQAWAWLPWLWALAVAALETRTVRPALLAMAALAAQVLAGHPQVTYLGLAGLAFLMAAHALDPVEKMPADASGWRSISGALAAIALLAAIGIGAAVLAAGQWLPTYFAQAESNRLLATPDDIAFSFSAPAGTLATAVAPLVWGGPKIALAEFGYHETLAFVGGPALALALVGALVGGLRAWIALGGILTCVLLSLGNEGPLLPALLGLVPGIGSFRVPGRWLLPAVVLLALLAARGTAWLLQHRKPVTEPRTWPIWLGILLPAGVGLGLWAVGAGCRTDGGWWLEMVRAHATRQAAVDPRILAELAASASTSFTVVALACLAGAAAFLRPTLRPAIGVTLIGLVGVTALWFASLHTETAFRRPAADLAWTPAEVLAIRAQVGPRHRLATAAPLRQANWGGASQILVAGAYEPAVTVNANRYANLLANRPLSAYAVNFQVRRPSPWLDRLATSHVLLAATDQASARAFAAWPEVGSFASGRVLRRNPAPMDRISAPTHVAVQADAALAVTQLASTPADTVLLSAPLAHTEAARATLALEDDQPDRLAIRVTTDLPVVVVARDALASGWTATIDGQPAQIALCDGLFRAASVPAGEHRLVWAFSPPGWRLGLGMSLLSWLALAVGVLLASGRGPTLLRGRR